MPQILLIAAIGAGLLLVRRYFKKEQARIKSELAKTKDAMEKRDLESTVPLEQDPATGVYRPKEPR